MSKRPVAASSTGTTTRRRLGVILVDPLPVVRAGTRLLIDDRPDMEVLAEAGTADEGSRPSNASAAHEWSCWWDLGLAGEHDAYWLIRTLRQRYPTHADPRVRGEH